MGKLLFTLAIALVVVILAAIFDVTDRQLAGFACLLIIACMVVAMGRKPEALPDPETWCVVHDGSLFAPMQAVHIDRVLDSDLVLGFGLTAREAFRRARAFSRGEVFRRADQVARSGRCSTEEWRTLQELTGCTPIRLPHQGRHTAPGQRSA